MSPTANKLFSSAELTLVKKDLSAIWKRKGVRTLLMLMPVVLVFVLPLVYVVAITLMPTVDTPPQALQSLVSFDAASGEYRAFWLDVFAKLVCPVLFLCVPIVCAVASASCAFVGEKTGGTLETLLLSSMNSKSIFNAKVTACTLITVIISLISFVVFAITMSVADIMLSAPFFLTLEWLATALLLMPALALFSVVFVSLIITKVHSTAEALQTMGYLILPFAALCIIQLAGAFRLSFITITLLSVILFVLDIILFNVSAGNFKSELLFANHREQ